MATQALCHPEGATTEGSRSFASLRMTRVKGESLKLTFIVGMVVVNKKGLGPRALAEPRP
ncbi:MAG: hypothetical protein Q8911_03155 [Bacillota bacterium]|nr:hypothetical protein [Bacillota bacterium]